MNITAVATAGMFHAIEFRDRQRSCQRRAAFNPAITRCADEPIWRDRTGQDDVKVEPHCGAVAGPAMRHVFIARQQPPLKSISLAGIHS